MNANFDIIICCYGEYYELIKKSVDSVINYLSFPVRIHIGLNNCDIKTKNYFRELLDKNQIATLIDSNQNINKDPMMRKLIDCVKSEYFLWLDDDTYPIKKGWDRLIQESTKFKYDVGGFAHISSRNVFPEYKSFLEKRPWFKSWDKYKNVENEDLLKEKIIFPIGYVWTGKKDFFIKNNYPDQLMIKKCDDMLLGEMIYQTDAKFHLLGPLWDYFEKNSYQRRGDGEDKF